MTPAVALAREVASGLLRTLERVNVEDVREDGPLFARLEIQVNGRSFVVSVEEIR